MKSFLDLKVQVDLFHEPVNQSPLPWAGISYSVHLSPINHIRKLFRPNWLRELETATLAAVVSYYRRGVKRPGSLHLVLPVQGKPTIIGVASQSPEQPSFWYQVRQLTPSGKRQDLSEARSDCVLGQQERSSNADALAGRASHNF